MPIALRTGTEGRTKQFQVGETLEIDRIERLNSSGDIQIGASLGADELQLGSAAALVRSMGDAQVDGQLLVQDGGGDTAFLLDLDQTGTNPGRTRIFVGDRTPEGNVTANAGDLYVRDNGASSTMYIFRGTDATSTGWADMAAAGSGDVVGPGSATDHAVARYDGTTGKLLQDSGVLINDSDHLFSAQYILGADLSLIPVAGGQSVMTSWHGLQLVGNKQSTVEYTPVNVGTNNQFGVLVPSQDTDADASFAIIGAGGQTGSLQQWLDDSLNVIAELEIGGDFNTTTNGSTAAFPRIIGFSDFTAGEAAMFQFGDSENILYNSHGGAMQLASFHTLILLGDQNGTHTVGADTTTNIGVLVRNSVASSPALVVDGAASQTADLLQLRTSAAAVLWDVDASGNQDLHDNDLTNIKTATFTEYDNGNSGASPVVDWNNGQKQTITLNAATPAFTFTDPPGAGNFVLRIVQDAVGGRSPTWPSNIRAPNSTLQIATAATTGVTLVGFYFDGTNYWVVSSAPMTGTVTTTLV